MTYQIIYRSKSTASTGNSQLSTPISTLQTPSVLTKEKRRTRKRTTKSTKTTAAAGPIAVAAVVPTISSSSSSGTGSMNKASLKRGPSSSSSSSSSSTSTKVQQQSAISKILPTSFLSTRPSTSWSSSTTSSNNHHRHRQTKKGKVVTSTTTRTTTRRIVVTNHNESSIPPINVNCFDLDVLISMNKNNNPTISKESKLKTPSKLDSSSNHSHFSYGKLSQQYQPPPPPPQQQHGPNFVSPSPSATATSLNYSYRPVYNTSEALQTFGTSGQITNPILSPESTQYSNNRECNDSQSQHPLSPNTYNRTTYDSNSNYHSQHNGPHHAGQYYPPNNHQQNDYSRQHQQQYYPQPTIKTYPPSGYNCPPTEYPHTDSQCSTWVPPPPGAAAPFNPIGNQRRQVAGSMIMGSLFSSSSSTHHHAPLQQQHLPSYGSNTAISPIVGSGMGPSSQPMTIGSSGNVPVDSYHQMHPYAYHSYGNLMTRPKPRGPAIYVLPRSIGPIYEPNVNDVLSGRGGRVNAHIGNIKFRELVATRKQDYISHLTKKLDKAFIAADIVYKIRTLDPPGRFLKEESDGVWFDIGDHRAIKKVGQALREDATELRSEMELNVIRKKKSGDDDDDKKKNDDSNKDDDGDSSSSSSDSSVGNKKPTSSNNDKSKIAVLNKEIMDEGTTKQTSGVDKGRKVLAAVKDIMPLKQQKDSVSKVMENNPSSKQRAEIKSRSPVEPNEQMNARQQTIHYDAGSQQQPSDLEHEGNTSPPVYRKGKTEDSSPHLDTSQRTDETSSSKGSKWELNPIRVVSGRAGRINVARIKQEQINLPSIQQDVSPEQQEVAVMPKESTVDESKSSQRSRPVFFPFGRHVARRRESSSCESTGTTARVFANDKSFVNQEIHHVPEAQKQKPFGLPSFVVNAKESRVQRSDHGPSESNMRDVTLFGRSFHPPSSMVGDRSDLDSLLSGTSTGISALTDAMSSSSSSSNPNPHYTLREIAHNTWNRLNPLHESNAASSRVNEQLHPLAYLPSSNQGIQIENILEQYVPNTQQLNRPTYRHAASFPRTVHEGLVENHDTSEINTENTLLLQPYPYSGDASVASMALSLTSNGVQSLRTATSSVENSVLSDLSETLNALDLAKRPGGTTQNSYNNNAVAITNNHTMTSDNDDIYHFEEEE